MSVDSIFGTLLRAKTGDDLDLGPDAFGAGDLKTVFSACLPADGHLKVSGVDLRKDETAGTVTATGTGVGIPFAGMHVIAVFSDSARGVELELTATANDEWTLATAFPLLAGSVVDQLKYVGASLKLTSDPGAAQGLVFDGEVRLPPGYSAVGWLMNNVLDHPLGGHITMRGAAPEFRLTAGIAGALTVGLFTGLTIEFVLDAKAFPWQPPGTTEQGGAALDAAVQWQARTSMGVSADLTVAGADTSIFIDLADPAGMVPVTLDVTQLTNLTIEQLESLVPSADLAGSLPPKSTLDPGRLFSLVAGRFVVDPRKVGTDALALVELVLTTDAAVRWTIADGIDVESIGINFAVLHPFTSQMQVRASIFGLVGWPGGELCVSASVPDVELGAGLTEGSEVPVDAVLQKLLPTPIETGLHLDSLDLRARPLAGTYHLEAGITGDWRLDLGATTVELLGAWIRLDYDKAAQPTTTGAIEAKAGIAGIELDATWTLPRRLHLTAALPEIDLARLASAVTRTSPPAGLPPIRLARGEVEITVGDGDHAKTKTKTLRSMRALAAGPPTTMYDFRASANVTMDGHGTLGAGFFDVRRTSAGTGFILGIDVPAGWSPGDVFPALHDLFAGLVFEQTGVIVASVETDRTQLPNLSMPSLPAQVGLGLTFFTTLKLEGAGLGRLAGLFATDVHLDLLGIINIADPKQSTIKAVLGNLQARGAMTFTGLTLELFPAAERFDVSAGVILHIGSEDVTITGKGTVTLEPPALGLELTVSEWTSPFGVHGLTVDMFGVKITAEAEGGIYAGLLGDFSIGTGDRKFRFLIGGELDDFEVPGSIVCTLESASHTLMLSDLIEQFTTLDVENLPVLSDIGFKDIDFTLVDNPAGFSIGDRHFPPGIHIAADITIHDWEASFEVTVSTGGVYAKGSVSKPIGYEDLLVIANATGDKGPEFLIDTSALVALPAHQPRSTAIAAIAHGTPPHLLAESPHQAARPRVPSRPPTAREALLAEELMPKPFGRSVVAGSSPYLHMSASLSMLGVLHQSVEVTATKDTFDFEFRFAFLESTAQLSCHLSGPKKSLAASGAVDFEFDLSLPPWKAEGGITVIPAIVLRNQSANIAASLALDLGASPPTGGFRIRLTFKYHDVPVDVGFSVTLAQIANSVENLWREIRCWLVDHVDEVWKEILDDVRKFVKAIRDGVLDFGKDDVIAVARALRAGFNPTTAQLASLLKELAYGFRDIVDALVQVAGAEVDQAVDIAKELFGDATQCAVRSTGALLHAPETHGRRTADVAVSGKVLTDLTASDRGQRLLYHYYLNEPEIRALAVGHPTVRRHLEHPDEDVLALAAAGRYVPLVRHVLDALETSGSADLIEAVGCLRAELAGLTDATYDEFLTALAGGQR